MSRLTCQVPPGVSLLAYGVFSALVSLITWRVLLRMALGRPLVESEAAGWFSAVPSSAVIAVGGVVGSVRTAEGLPEPILRVGRLGSALSVALAFVLPPGTGDIACQDRVRRAVRDGLGDLPYSVSITVEFGYDADLFK